MVWKEKYYQQNAIAFLYYCILDCHWQSSCCFVIHTLLFSFFFSFLLIKAFLLFLTLWMVIGSCLSIYLFLFVIFCLVSPGTNNLDLFRNALISFTIWTTVSLTNYSSIVWELILVSVQYLEMIKVISGKKLSEHWEKGNIDRK